MRALKWLLSLPGRGCAAAVFVAVVLADCQARGEGTHRQGHNTGRRNGNVVSAADSSASRRRCSQLPGVTATQAGQRDHDVHVFVKAAPRVCQPLPLPMLNLRHSSTGWTAQRHVYIVGRMVFVLLDTAAALGGQADAASQARQEDDHDGDVVGAAVLLGQPALLRQRDQPLRRLLGAGARSGDVHGRLAGQHAPEAVAGEQQQAIGRGEADRGALRLRRHAHPARPRGPRSAPVRTSTFLILGADLRWL